ncbi:PREDICTED: uncharacterized protein LOC104782993 [Camelina sativa]|uniref:Uncharacterized protein LOC104782993 n=1 Tax=Camelina sativa TaxID=90675 RepID=A0ABM0YV86_CAMSA|nr:PREDICTED: uncharacterized protein LOC104782993 [Camelina sativa]
MTQTPPPPPDDVELRSIMMERLSLAVARGGLEMEEKLKNHFVGVNSPYVSFLFPSGPDHSLYKQKIAEYTKSPPHPPPTLLPPRQGLGGGFRGLTEVVALTFQGIAFTVGIPPGMTLKELGIMKFVAHFVVRYGDEFQRALRSTDNSQFKFLLKGDKRSELFSGLCCGYGFLIKTWSPARLDALLEGFNTCFTAFKKKLDDDGEEDETVNKVETDRRDFVVCDEYFVDLENKYLPPMESPMAMMGDIDIHDSHSHGLIFMVPPNPIFFRVVIPERGMMRKELGIIKFTAMFVMRFGDEFLDALRERVCEPEFDFMKSNPGNDIGRYKLFSELLLAYGNVIKRWDMRPKTGFQPARMEAVLEGFFTALNAFKKKHEDEEDEVVDTVVTDRRDFVVSQEYFQYFLEVEESTPLPERPTPRPRQTGSSASRSGFFGPPLGVLLQRSLVLENPEPRTMMQPTPQSRVLLIIKQCCILNSHPSPKSNKAHSFPCYKRLKNHTILVKSSPV